MSVTLVVAGSSFEYPTVGENPGWGEDATAWAEAITEVINSFQGTNDILPTTVAIADNQASFIDILGFIFDPASVRSFEAEYNVFRTDGTTNFTETGRIIGVYNETDWEFSFDRAGDAGMDFQITAAGQIQYTSSSIGGVHSGSIKFRAKTLDK